MWKNAFIAAVTVTALSLASSLGAHAQAIPPTFPTKAPDMSPMHFLMGTWNCRGPGMTSTLTYTSTMDGMWMLGTGEAAASSGGGKQSSYLYMTFDKPSNRWVLMSANSGGGYGMSYSSGWQADMLQWKSAASGGSMQGDMTMRRVSDTQLQITQSLPDQTGYQKMQTFTCTKSAS
ncbi:MAG: hypothetical protein ACXWNK_17525 [Vulcanimicrobiaceae bacterium]